jgi:hypothetical protein
MRRIVSITGSLIYIVVLMWSYLLIISPQFTYGNAHLFAEGFAQAGFRVKERVVAVPQTQAELMPVASVVPL